MRKFLWKQSVTIALAASMLAGNTMLPVKLGMTAVTVKATTKSIPENPTVIDGMIYATVNMEYADFYYGELNDLADAGTMLNLDADLVTEAGYREEEMYDAVTSATVMKSTRFPATYYVEGVTNKEMPEVAEGVNILGIKDTKIAIKESLYKQLLEQKDQSHKVYEYLANATYQQEAFDEYKELRADGTFGKMITKVENRENLKNSITTSSVWGNYQISIEGLGTDVTTSNMLGVVLEDEDGNKYGMQHLDNLWLQTGELSFAVRDNFIEPHKNHVPAKRYKALEGKVIKKITYLIKDAADIVINTELRCKTLNDASVKGSAAPAFYDKTGTKVAFTFENLPASYTLDKVVKGTRHGLIVEADRYVYEKGTQSITFDESVEVGDDYVATFVSDLYGDITVIFEIQEKTTPKISLKAKTVTYTGKTLSVDHAVVSGSTGKVTYTYYTDAACTKKATSHVNAGVYYVKATVAETDITKKATSKSVKFTIKKAVQTITTKKGNVTYTKTAVKKSAKTFVIGAKAKGSISYKVVSGTKYVTVNKAGKVTVKKSAKSGTYKIKIYAKATTNHNAATKTVTIKVK